MDEAFRDAMDEALSQERVLRPSADFTARVMHQVRLETAAPQALEFPWKRFLPGMATALALSVGAVMLFGLGGAATVPTSGQAARWLDTLTSPLARQLSLALGAMLGSLGFSWSIVRWATRSARQVRL